MYDYTENKGFKLRCVNHDVTFLGLKDYQMLFVLGCLIICLSSMSVGLASIFLMASFFRVINKRALQEKHISLSKPVLWIYWKFIPFRPLLPHLDGLKETQKVYRN